MFLSQAEDSSSSSSSKAKRGYCMVLNNYTDHEESRMKTFWELNQVNVIYFCFGKEVAPTTLTPHLQAYVYLKHNKTMIELQAILSRHLGLPSRWAIKVANGNSKQNRTYCGKFDTPTPNAQFFEWGKVPKGQGKRTDLDGATDLIMAGGSIRDVALEHPGVFVKFERGLRSLEQLITTAPRDRSRVPRVYWLRGPTGCGKSMWAHDLGDLLGSIYVKNPENKWWCGFHQQKVVLIDDYRSNKELSFATLLRLCDRYAMTVEIKGGSVEFNCDYIIITCPVGIRECFAHIENLTTEGRIDQLERRVKEYDMSDPQCMIRYLQPAMEEARVEVAARTPVAPVIRQTVEEVDEVHPWMLENPFDNLAPSRLEAYAEPPRMIRQTNAPSPVSIACLNQDEEYAQFPEVYDLSFLDDVDFTLRPSFDNCMDDDSVDITQEEARSDGGMYDDYLPTDDDSVSNEDGWN